jgi:hypothetical protein
MPGATVTYEHSWHNITKYFLAVNKNSQISKLSIIKPKDFVNSAHFSSHHNIGPRSFYLRFECLILDAWLFFQFVRISVFLSKVMTCIWICMLGLNTLLQRIYCKSVCPRFAKLTRIHFFQNVKSVELKRFLFYRVTPTYRSLLIKIVL